MYPDNIIFTQRFDIENNIYEQRTQFLLGDTEYTMIFSSGNSLTESFVAQVEDNTPNHHQSYSIKFTATQRIDEFYATGNSENLYKSPRHQSFSYQEIKRLHQILVEIILTHQKTFQIQCYYFVAETASLQKTYQRLCTQCERNLIELKTIVKKDCFILVFNPEKGTS